MPSCSKRPTVERRAEQGDVELTESPLLRLDQRFLSRVLRESRPETAKEMIAFDPVAKPRRLTHFGKQQRVRSGRPHDVTDLETGHRCHQFDDRRPPHDDRPTHLGKSSDESRSIISDDVGSHSGRLIIGAPHGHRHHGDAHPVGEWLHYLVHGGIPRTVGVKTTSGDTDIDAGAFSGSELHRQDAGTENRCIQGGHRSRRSSSRSAVMAPVLDKGLHVNRNGPPCGCYDVLKVQVRCSKRMRNSE